MPVFFSKSTWQSRLIFVKVNPALGGYTELSKVYNGVLVHRHDPNSGATLGPTLSTKYRLNISINPILGGYIRV